MIDERERYERAFQQFRMTEPAWEILVDRRDRKRRNKRIAAGVVGIAVFVAAVWIVTSGGSFDRSQTPAVPGPTETGPTEAPATGSEDNSYRIPPEGTAVSTPVEGELIAEAYVGMAGLVQVYADGRVLSAEHNGGIIVERRLSPEGVELVRQVVGERVHHGYWGPGAGRLQSLLGYPGLSSEIAQSAWEDREGKPYVPARYGACFWQVDSPPDFEALLDLLPASAQALLRGSDPAARNPRCLVVTPEEARSLEGILSEERSSRRSWPNDGIEVGAWSLRDGNRDQFISIRPLFPDGRRFFRVPF